MNTTRTAAAQPEVMANRRTADGVLVQFWTDGAITHGHFAQWISRSVSTKIIWIIAGEVGVYDFAEVKTLVKAARKALDKHTREPHRVLESDLLRLTRAYAAA